MAKFEFGFEEAWLRLIIKKIPDHPNLFLPSAVEHAQTILRVGKLKVSAARAWAEAAGIIIKKKNQFILTPLGNLIKRHDPDMDDDGIWWALHYNLARQESSAWFYAFYCNEFTRDVFDRDMLEEELRAWWDQDHEKPMTDSIFDKLVFSPLKQAFAGTRLGKEFGFFDLQEGGRFCRQAPGYRVPPVAIVAYGLLDWARQQQRQTVNLEKLLEAWSVGRIFRLDRASLDEIIVQIGDQYNKQVGWVSHTAGLNSVSIMDLPPLTLLSAYYHGLDGESPTSALEKGKTEVLELEKIQTAMPLFS